MWFFSSAAVSLSTVEVVLAALGIFLLLNISNELFVYPKIDGYIILWS